MGDFTNIKRTQWTPRIITCLVDYSKHCFIWNFSPQCLCKHILYYNSRKGRTWWPLKLLPCHSCSQSGLNVIYILFSSSQSFSTTLVSRDSLDKWNRRYQSGHIAFVTKVFSQTQKMYTACRTSVLKTLLRRYYTWVVLEWAGEPVMYLRPTPRENHLTHDLWVPGHDADQILGV